MFVCVLLTKPHSCSQCCTAFRSSSVQASSCLDSLFPRCVAMSRSSRQTSLHEFCFRMNSTTRSRSPCSAQHAFLVCDQISVHSSGDSDACGAASETLPTALPASNAITGYHLCAAIGPFSYFLWQCMDLDARAAYQAISFWARSDSRWHARDLGMWDRAPQAPAEEHAESEPGTADSSLPDSEIDTVYLTLPRKAG